MRGEMRASINKNEFYLNDASDLKTYINALTSVTPAEAWIYTDASSLCILKTNDCAFLMYQDNSEDTSETANDESQHDDLIEFTLANGQVDEYPGNMCVAYSTAVQAIEHFYKKSGLKYPKVNWCD